MTFECSTSETGLTLFTLSASPPIGISSLSHLPNGDQKLTLTITVTESYNNMHFIVCAASRNGVLNQTTAVLKIQGIAIIHCIVVKYNPSLHCRSPVSCW